MKSLAFPAALAVVSLLASCIEGPSIQKIGKDVSADADTQTAGDTTGREGALADVAKLPDAEVRTDADVLPDGGADTGTQDVQADETNEPDLDVGADTECISDCQGKECGDDGCDGTCGTCGEFGACKTDNTCLCEFQKCQGACCTEGEVCFGSTCCLPDCEGKQCGDDGCDGSCGPYDGQCDDGNPCTTDSCNANGICDYSPNEEPSDDGNPCTDPDGCEEGVCSGTLKSLEELTIGDCICEADEDCSQVEDGNLCNGTLHCAYSHLEGDNETEMYTCQVAQETNLEFLGCDDGNPCTDDSCEPQPGCVFEADDENSCSDGNPCNGLEKCVDADCRAVTLYCSAVAHHPRVYLCHGCPYRYIFRHPPVFNR